MIKLCYMMSHFCESIPSGLPLCMGYLTLVLADIIMGLFLCMKSITQT